MESTTDDEGIIAGNSQSKGPGKGIVKWLYAVVAAIVATIIVVLAICKGNNGFNIAVTPSRHAAHSGTPSPSKVFTVNGVSFAMIPVDGGTFQIGATSEQVSDADVDESPVHRVTLSSYMIGETEVTQALWQVVMGDNPSNWKGDDLPVEQVSWNDCQMFIAKLNDLTKESFRLPTEAEWEYAARGGNMSNHTKYSGGSNIDKVAWYSDNSGNRTHAVKSKLPNELGLYDMSGNVHEWCQDWKDNYSIGSQTNPKGASSGSKHVLRGGSWSDYARYCRVSFRASITPGYRIKSIGLRLAL